MGRGRLLQAVHREAEELVCPGELSEELSPLKGRKKRKRIYSVWRLTLVDKQADRVSSVFDDLLHSSKHRLRKRSTGFVRKNLPTTPAPAPLGGRMVLEVDGTSSRLPTRTCRHPRVQRARGWIRKR